ncbi:MAG: hypothetical protein QGI11_05530 [Nitrospinota bacterium]|nr:hypothetical protein [Nitrospinota bacterium]MDP7369444.1 hypothetical protein [Nitrospinota bacterium]MDP7662507.1 hypothetical protein [Nitrospinota bacterium]
MRRQCAPPLFPWRFDQLDHGANGAQVECNSVAGVAREKRLGEFAALLPDSFE